MHSFLNYLCGSNAGAIDRTAFWTCATAMIRKIRNHFAHSQVRSSFSDAACAETLLLLSSGKTDPPKAREGFNFMRFAYTCAVAQTSTILEGLEATIAMGGDIRATVLYYEREGAFMYNWQKSLAKRAT